MLLDPLEEELDLPAQVVQLADRQSCQRHMIGKKHQPSSLAVAVANAPQPLGIALLGVKDDQLHILVANQSRAAIDGPRADTLEFEVGSGTGNEEALALMEPVEPLEVEVSAIHNIEGTRLGDEHIEDVDVVQFAIGNMDETGNRSAQVEQRVEFERRFGRTKLGPRKQRQAQVDGSSIQGIDCFGKIHRKGILSIQTTCRADKTLSELRIDSPVPPLVGVCQHTSTHRAPKAHVIELAGLCTETRLDVAQALAVGQLREGHSQKLVQAAEGAHVEIAAILCHQTTKGMPRRELHELGENQIATVHQHLPGKSRKSAENTLANSNR